MAQGIEIKIGLDTKQADKDLAAFKGRFKSAIDSNTAALTALRAAFVGLGVAGAAAFTEMARKAVDAAIAVDKTRNALIALTGSAEAANRKLTELRALAQASPGVTTNFATQLFQQLKAIGGIGDQVINSVIKSLGKLNAVFGDVGPEFARNLIQIFQQGFERSDIKEALTRVPIFEQLLKSAFGTDDPDKLRKLKDAGKITMETFMTGISESINTRFPQVADSIGSQFEKLQDRITQALAPIGDEIIKVLLPVIRSLAQEMERVAPLIARAFKDNEGAIRSMADAIGNVTSQIASLVERLTALDAKIALVRNSIRSYLALLGLLSPGLALQLGLSFERGVIREDDAAAREAGLTRGSPFLTAPDPNRGSPFLSSDARQVLKNAATVASTKNAAGGARRSITQLGGRAPDFGLNDAELIAHEAELARIRQANEAVAARRAAAGLTEGRPAQLAGFNAANLERIRQIEIETLKLEENTAKKAREELKKIEPVLSNSERLMKGLANATITVGDAFERFGENVAQAFGNVRNLFQGLKSAVLGFFNDLIGSTLQNLVKNTLGGLFGGIGGALGRGGGGLGNLFRTPPTFPASVSGGGGGVTGALGSIVSGGGGVGGAAAAGKFSLSGLGASLGAAAPFLGFGIGSSLGGKSRFGQVLGAAGGILGGTLAGVLTGGITNTGIVSAFLGPLGAIAGPLAAGLIVGSILLGKAKQRKADEEASGQMLTQALNAITQLGDGVATGRIDASQAKAIFENQILAEFIQGINTLKTESVRKSRLTNQVADLRRVFSEVIPPAIAQQQARSANALAFSRQIPEFATGGITRGGLAVLHPAEMVLNLQQQTAIARMAGPGIFNAAGVPGVQNNRIFDSGGIMPSSGGPSIVIDELTVVISRLGIGQSEATVIATAGMSSERGRQVTVNNVKVARTNREL